jgi:hypothetical protein
MLVVMSRVPAFLERLIDDAAVFPPGNTPLPQAIEEHVASRADAYRSAITGPLVIAAPALPELVRLIATTPHSEPLDVSVVVPSPDAVADVLETDSADVTIVGLEIKVADAVGIPEVLTGIRRDLGDALPPSAVSVEIPWPTADRQAWADALRAVGAAGMKVKLRTGGTVRDAFPSVDLLADAVTILTEERTPFKCTAGLHTAVRHVDPVTGFPHHGFLNILVATVRALHGGTRAETVAILALEDRAMLARAFALVTPQQMATARSAFTSYGSCSIDEPLDDLRQLGLLTAEPAAQP